MHKVIALVCLPAVLALPVIALAEAERPAPEATVKEQAASRPAAEAQVEKKEEAKQPVSLAKAVGVIGVCLGAGLSAIAGAYGIGRVGSACIDAMARQPEASGTMFAPMVVAAAMIEGGMLFAILVCLLAVMMAL